jgi:hypothetical protein
MRLDHLTFAAEPDGLLATTERLSRRLGVEPLDGGVHPRFGTRNMLLPMSGLQYVEVVEVLEHPVAAKCSFGQAVRAQSDAGGGWMAWVVSVEDIAGVAARLGRRPAQGHRVRPDGIELWWKQIGVSDLLVDSQLPFYVQWEVPDAARPGADRPSGARITGLAIAGHPGRVSDWLRQDVAGPLTGLEVHWLDPGSEPGLRSATFAIESGEAVTV